MRHRHGGGRHRHESPVGAHEREDGVSHHPDHHGPDHHGPERHGPERHGGRHGSHHGSHHGGRHGGGRGGRMFDYGELRLVVLAMISEEPRHGYELMRAIEERMGGSYSPSPGVIYPTLSWLEDMGYTLVEAEGGGRKRYRITPEGAAFLKASRAALDDLFARIGSAGKGGRYEGVPAPVVRGMENLKLALRLRLRRGPLEQAAAESIANALDSAAQAIERS